MHGQSDQLRLAQPAHQSTALDLFAALDTTAYEAVFHQWRKAVDRLTERTERARELRRKSELLAHGLAEVETAAPVSGEDRALAAEARRLAHVDGLRLAAGAAHDALVGDADDFGSDAGDVATLIARAQRELAAAHGADAELDSLARRMIELSDLAVDLAGDLRNYRDGLDADPGRLAEVEARRAILAGLVRRYGEDLDAVLDWAAGARERLHELDVSDEALEALARERDARAQRCAELAVELSRARSEAATRLSAAVTAELRGLAMPDAAVHVRGLAAGPQLRRSHPADRRG